MEEQNKSDSNKLYKLVGIILITWNDGLLFNYNIVVCNNNLKLDKFGLY